MFRSLTRIPIRSGLVALGLTGALAVRAAVVSVPDDATAPSGSTVGIPISATPANGILGIDIRIQYDADVLTAIGATRTPISQTFTLTTNLTTPGLARISLFHSAPMSGSGPIAIVEFDVIGPAGASTVLDLTLAQINEGTIPSELDDGFFTACLGPPAEVAELSVAKTPLTTVSWASVPGATAYDLVSGSVAELRADGGIADASCLAPEVAGTATTDPRPDPPGGGGHYYIARAQGNCGSGSYGWSTLGAPRIPSADCP